MSIARLFQSTTPIYISILAALSGYAQATPESTFVTTITTGTPVYYVAEKGNDSAAGTQAQPLATLEKAISKLQPNTGGIIRILPGTIYERVAIDYRATKDNPLIIEGAKSPAGERLSAVDGSNHLQAEQWQKRPELGPGVYAYPYRDSDPGIVLVNDKMVARLNPDGPHHSTWNDIGSAKKILQWPEDQRVKTMYHSRTNGEDATIPFWETLGGVYTPGEGEFYLRLFPEANPNAKEVAVAASGATVEIKNGSHVILRNLIIKGSEYGVNIGGDDAEGNRVEGCYIPHGRYRINVSNGAKNTSIVGNLVEMGFIGHPTGAWGEGYGEKLLSPTESAQAAQREFLYNFFKYWASRASTSQDWAIRLERGTQGEVRVEDNTLDGGLIGIGMYAETGDILIRNNTIRNFSSVGTAFTQGTYRLIYDGNLFANSNINIRPHNRGFQGKRDVYILRNTSLLPKGLGQHLYNHSYSSLDKSGKRVTSTKEYLDEKVTLYHNNFFGGVTTLSMSFFRDDKGELSQDELNMYKHYRVLNNNFINSGAVVNGLKELIQDGSKFGAFDHNFVSGSRYNRFGKPAWWGQHNVFNEEQNNDWSWDMSGFTAPKNTSPREIGIDVSIPFEVDGKIYDPLPELKQKYFSGIRPLTGWPQQ